MVFLPRRERAWRAGVVPASTGEDAMSDKRQESGKAGGERMNPGDVAPPGTPGTGEDICPDCQGTGRLHNAPCQNCGGTGKVIAGIAGG
jgi:hypothetical protein